MTNYKLSKLCYYFTIIILILSIIIGIFICKSPNMAYANSTEETILNCFDKLYIEKQDYVLDNRVDYYDNIIMVTLKSAYSEPNKEFPEDLMKICRNNSSTSVKNKDSELSIYGIESIKDLTYIPVGNTLVNPKIFNQTFEITINTHNKRLIAMLTAEISKSEKVLISEPKYIYAIKENGEPNDPLYTNQWGFDEECGVHIQEAWDYIGSEPLNRIKVGIFEKNVDFNHEDLNVTQSNFTPAGDASAIHGTNVAGIIGATKNNNLGIAGIADVDIVLLNPNDFAGSINWAIENDVKIINASYCMTISEVDDTPAAANAYDANAIRTYQNMGGLIICSAGNNGTNTDNTQRYPSGYADKRYYPDINNVLSVGAINQDGSISFVSNYGANTVDIFAPGTNIMTTTINNEYTNAHGTSIAAPHVTGVAALIKSYNPYLSNEEIIDAIISNVDLDPDLSNKCVTGGKLNAYKAIKSVYKTKDLFNNFGYEGEEFYWRGEVLMSTNTAGVLNGSGGVIIPDDAILNFEVKELESYNLVMPINGTIEFALKSSNGSIVQTHTTTASVNILNQSSLSDATFSIDTSNLDVETYTLTLTSHFTRGPSYYEDHTYNYVFAVQRPVEAMSGFGYLASWYKWKGEVLLLNDVLYSYSKDSFGRYVFNKSTTLNFEICTDSVFNAVREITGSVTLSLKDSAGSEVVSHYCEVRVGLVSNVTLSNDTFSISTSSYSNDTYTLYLSCTMTRAGTTYNNSASYSFVIDRPSSSSCITTGSLITLADGTQTAVENLTGNEQLLVWDMLNGTFASAPILFIDIDPTTTYEVITLTFSDGTTVNIIDEHAFYDTTLNKYVFLRSDASQYIGHYFTKQILDGNNNMTQTTVQLVDVTIEEQITTAYSPVTYGHLCYYVNGMLSMPGNTESFINIFDVDPTTMSYDEDAMAQDIATYGLYTYEEFNDIIPIPQLVFDAFNGQYLKVAIGKGITTLQEIQALLNRYSEFFE